MSPDVIALNQNLSPRQLKTARVKPKQEPKDYEQMLHDQCAEAGLPLPLRQVEFAKVVKIGFRADLGWVSERIIVEVNGQIWQKGGHNTGNGLRRDYYKQNLAQLLGFRYFEFSPDMVENGTALKVLLCAFGRLDTFEQDWKGMQP